MYIENLEIQKLQQASENSPKHEQKGKTDGLLRTKIPPHHLRKYFLQDIPTSTSCTRSAASRADTHKATDLKDRYVSRTELNRVYRWYASTESILPTSRWHMALNLRTMTSKKKDHHLQKNASTLAAAALTGPGGFFEMPSKCLNAPAARPSPSSRLPRTVGKGCTTSETETGSIQESILQIPNVHRTRTPMQKSEQRAVRTFGPFSKSQETGARR